MKEGGMNRWAYCLAAVFVLLVGEVVSAVDFRVTGEVVTKEFVGFGVNVSPYVYCAPNWPGEVNEGNVGEFERRVEELRPQHVRIFVKPEWWDTKREQYRGESVERLCRLMERVGATVNLTLWGGVHDETDMARRMAAVFARLIVEKKLTCVRYATLQNEPNSFNMDKDKYVRLYRVFDAELRRLGVRDR